MSTTPNIENLIRETRRYEFKDGLRDIQFGLMIFASGLVVWLAFNPNWVRFSLFIKERAGKFSAILLVFLVVMLPSLVALLVSAVANWVRRRWLWRQSGYVKPSRWAVSRTTTLISGAIFIIGILMGVFFQDPAQDPLRIWRVLWASAGVSFGYTLLAMGLHLKLQRYIFLGILGGLLSAGLVFIPVGLQFGSLALGLVWGVLLLISGGLTLKQTWPSAQEVE